MSERSVPGVAASQQTRVLVPMNKLLLGCNTRRGREGWAIMRGTARVINAASRSRLQLLTNLATNHRMIDSCPRVRTLVTVAILWWTRPRGCTCLETTTEKREPLRAAVRTSVRTSHEYRHDWVYSSSTQYNKELRRWRARTRTPIR